jgi:hypothetical protein
MITGLEALRQVRPVISEIRESAQRTHALPDTFSHVVLRHVPILVPEQPIRVPKVSRVARGLRALSRNWKLTPAASRAWSNRERSASAVSGRPLSSWMRYSLCRSRGGDAMRSNDCGQLADQVDVSFHAGLVLRDQGVPSRTSLRRIFSTSAGRWPISRAMSIAS